MCLLTPHIILANELVKVNPEMLDLERDNMQYFDTIAEKLRLSIMEHFAVNGFGSLKSTYS